MLEFVTIAVVQWVRARKIRRHEKIVTDALKELQHLTVTMHGRYLLGQVCLDTDNGLDPELRRIYWILLQAAPVAVWAEMN